jgi:hypothetical protein
MPSSLSSADEAVISLDTNMYQSRQPCPYTHSIDWVVLSFRSGVGPPVFGPHHILARCVGKVPLRSAARYDITRQ